MSEVAIRDKQTIIKNKSKEYLDAGENVDKLNESTISLPAEHKIASLNELKIADHVVLVLTDSKGYRHAILDKLNEDKKIIEIIYYDDIQVECNLNKFKFDDKSDNLSCEKNGVKKITLCINLDQIDIYKADYDYNNEKCLPIEETLEKANKLVGQTKYNIFANNDEHFAIYCKTGKAAKLFIINPNEISAKNIIGKSIGQKITTNLAQEGAQILLVNTAKHIASKFPRSAVSASLPVAAEAAGSAIGAGIEGFSMGYDIYHKHKELKEGKLTEIKFKKYIARRVTRGVNSVAGGVAGGIVGQLVIPIPVVGAVVGGIVGGLVGALAGQGEGILIGELVEVIDTKIKEKRVNNEVSLIAAENLNEKESKISYNVIDKLVFKFDKDLLKEENWAHLDDVEAKLDIKNDASKFYLDENNNKSNDVLYINNANEKINDDDYEIFVLNDSKEIIENLNMQSCLDSNGAILKRNSLEAYSADQLPDNLNIFFKIIDKDKDA